MAKSEAFFSPEKETRRSEALTEKTQELQPLIVNPFKHDTPLGFYELVKLGAGILFLFPLRLILIMPCVFLSYCFAKVSIAGLDEQSLNQPLSKWRKAIFYPVKVLCRVVLFLMGFYYIKLIGTKANPSAAPIIVSNHISVFDPLLLFYVFMPSFVSKKEVENIPLFGTFTKAAQLIMVDRRSKDSRNMAATQIKQRLERVLRDEHSFPQLLIFPEGTTTNGKCLINFRHGAFVPGVPIQPVLIKYNYRHFNPSYTAPQGPSMLELAVRLLCQFTNNVQLTFLDVYVPSDSEKANPALFAQNVKSVMSKAGSLMVTENTFLENI